MSALCDAMRRLLTAMPTRYRKAIEVQRSLGIDPKLASQVFKLATASDPAAVGGIVPGPPSMRRFLDTARRQPIDVTLVDAVATAAAAYEQLIQRHAESRSAFESMVSAAGSASAQQLPDDETSPLAGLGPTATEAVDFRHRKFVFKGMSHFAGVQVRVMTLASIVHAGKRPGLVDIVHLRIRSGIRRLRPDPLLLDGRRVADSRGTEVQMSPLDPDASKRHGGSVLPQFSSKPLPELRTERTGDFTRTQLTGQPLGLQGEADLVFADISRDEKLTYSSSGYEIANNFAVALPTELAILDLFVHRPSLEAGPHTALAVEAHWDPRAAYVFGFAQLIQPMNVAERAAYLGSGPDAARTDDIPRYPEIVRHACSKMHWNPADFELFRLRIEYPLVHSSIQMKAGIKQ